MVNNEGSKKRSIFAITFYFFAGIIIPFSIYIYLNVHVWNISFNPVDFILKPFLLLPAALLAIAFIINGTSYAFRLIKQLSTPLLSIFFSTIMSYTIYNLVNIHVWNLSFNPIDFILKPFLIIPAMSLLLPLIFEWTGYAYRHAKALRLTIKKSGHKLSLKIVEKSLPIYIIDESYFNTEFELKNNTTIVDMRIKDNKHLSIKEDLEIVKLYNHGHQVNIPYLIEKANLLIKNTALKNKPVTFIVDSKKERNRTISKIWLRLIRNPRSRSATADIHTILELVY